MDLAHARKPTQSAPAKRKAPPAAPQAAPPAAPQAMPKPALEAWGHMQDQILARRPTKRARAPGGEALRRELRKLQGEAGPIVAPHKNRDAYKGALERLETQGSYPKYRLDGLGNAMQTLAQTIAYTVATVNESFRVGRDVVRLTGLDAYVCERALAGGRPVHCLQLNVYVNFRGVEPHTPAIEEVDEGDLVYSCGNIGTRRGRGCVQLQIPLGAATSDNTGRKGVFRGAFAASAALDRRLRLLRWGLFERLSRTVLFQDDAKTAVEKWWGDGCANAFPATIPDNRTSLAPYLLDKPLAREFVPGENIFTYGDARWVPSPPGVHWSVSMDCRKTAARLGGYSSFAKDPWFQNVIMDSDSGGQGAALTLLVARMCYALGRPGLKLAEMCWALAPVRHCEVAGEVWLKRGGLSDVVAALPLEFKGGPATLAFAFPALQIVAECPEVDPAGVLWDIVPSGSWAPRIKKPPTSAKPRRRNPPLPLRDDEPALPRGDGPRRGKQSTVSAATVSDSDSDAGE